jgi:hypothetical protein
MGTSFPDRSADTPGSGDYWIPATELEGDAIRRQLGLLLGSPLFSSSRRYSSLLKYVVEETLAGRAGDLKERTLGIQAFGRDPAYNTSEDPVVRTSAAKVRDRLAEYYLGACPSIPQL